MYKRYSGKLFCFSPPIMIATFAIEIIFALYVLWRYKSNTAGRLVVALLVFLAVFQFVEYNVCGGAGIEWAKLGFIAITALPPLGIHLATTLAQKRNWLLIGVAYLTGVLFIYFFAATHAITNQVCGGNYIIFDMIAPAGFYYGLYYYGWLIIGTVMTWWWSKEAKNTKNKRALQAFMAGYILLLLPTATVNILYPGTITAIPSIMCGFAIFLACVLVFWVMPTIGIKRKKRA